MTEQISDLLLWEGNTFQIDQHPMSSCPKMAQLAFLRRNSANWKGYEATWEIKENRMRLIGFQGFCRPGGVEGGPEVVRIPELFAGAEAPIFACWFTGALTGSTQFGGACRCEVVEGVVVSEQARS